MGIVVQHQPSLDVVGAAAQQAGYGNWLQRQQELGIQQQRFASQQQQRQQEMQMAMQRDAMDREQRRQEMMFARGNQLQDMGMQMQFRDMQNKQDFEQAKAINEQKRNIELGLVEEKWSTEQQLKQRQLQENMQQLEQSPLFRNLDPDAQNLAKQRLIDKAGIGGPMLITPDKVRDKILAERVHTDPATGQRTIISGSIDNPVIKTEDDPQLRIKAAQQERIQQLEFSSHENFQKAQTKYADAMTKWNEGKMKQEQAAIDAARKEYEAMATEETVFNGDKAEKRKVYPDGKVLEDLLTKKKAEYSGLYNSTVAPPQPPRREEFFAWKQGMQEQDPYHSGPIDPNMSQEQWDSNFAPQQQAVPQQDPAMGQSVQQPTSLNWRTDRSNAPPDSAWDGFNPNQKTQTMEFQEMGDGAKTVEGLPYTLTLPQYKPEREKYVNLFTQRTGIKPDVLHEEFARIQMNGEQTMNPKALEEYAVQFQADFGRAEQLNAKRLKGEQLTQQEIAEVKEIAERYKNLYRQE